MGSKAQHKHWEHNWKHPRLLIWATRIPAGVKHRAQRRQIRNRPEEQPFKATPDRDPADGGSACSLIPPASTLGYCEQAAVRNVSYAAVWPFHLPWASPWEWSCWALGVSLKFNSEEPGFGRKWRHRFTLPVLSCQVRGHSVLPHFQRSLNSLHNVLLFLVYKLSSFLEFFFLSILLFWVQSWEEFFFFRGFRGSM